MSTDIKNNSIEAIIERLESAELDLGHEISPEDLREDEDFIYLDIETSKYDQDDIFELGNYLNARSTSYVVGENLYHIAVPKTEF